MAASALAGVNSGCDDEIGIGVFVMHLTYLISKDYARATGGWIYNERLLTELARLGVRITRVDLPAGFPDPSPAALAEALAIVSERPAGELLLADQVCLAPLGAWLLGAAGKPRVAMIMHHPQILEGSRPPDIAARLDADERVALKAADCVIATSQLTGRQMLADYAVPDETLVVAEPGTDVFPASRRSRIAALQLLSIGSIIPRKRHDLLVGALGRLTDLDWHLTIVGDLKREPAHVAALRQLIADVGLADRVALFGEQSGPQLATLWMCTDVYLAASSHEGFGMAVAEAVARQIPVVSTYSGAVGDWLSREAGVIVEPDTVEAFAHALRPVLADPKLRAQMRAGAAAARASLPTWRQTATKVDAALRAL